MACTPWEGQRLVLETVYTVGWYGGNSGGMVKADGENNMELLKILNKKG